MSEKTFNEVGDEAASLYTVHKHVTSEPVQKSGFHPKPMVEQAVELNQMKAEKFAKDNAEQLHDLAVTEAHLGGTAITVEQPIEIGQKIEVHKS